MSTNRTEWGVRLLWPDGREEVFERADEESARLMAGWHNAPGTSICYATVLRRQVTVTFGDWEIDE